MTLSALIAASSATRRLDDAEATMATLRATLAKILRPAIKPPRPRVELPRERTAMDRLVSHIAAMAGIRSRTPCAADPDHRQSGTLLKGHLVHRLGSWHGEVI